MKDKISIIVPVYNVEKYLKKCLNSIINQTYTNLEIIVVNDGSLDNSDLIIKEFKELDNRIIYIKKENGGLSSARNAGLDIATGKYVLFVDSDDWLDLNAIEKLHNRIIDDCSDIVVYNLRYIYEDNYIKPRTPFIKDNMIVDSKNAIAELLKGRKFKFHAQSKFAKLSIYNDYKIRFSEGKIYEDVYTTYKIFLHANRISFYAEYLYYYLQNRSGSILNTKFNEKRLDIFGAMESVMKNSAVACMNLKNEIQTFYITNLISLFNYLCPLYITDKSAFKDYLKNINCKINKKYLKGYMFNPYLKISEKIRIFMIRKFIYVYVYIMVKIKGGENGKY